MKRGLALVAAMIAALAMPLAADARQHGGGGHKGGGHHMSGGHKGGGHQMRGHRRGGGHMGNPGHRAGKHYRGGGKHYGRHYNRGRQHGHHGRRFWHGRWYAYGIGPCWRWSPRYAEFVWVCY